MPDLLMTIQARLIDARTLLAENYLVKADGHLRSAQLLMDELVKQLKP